MIKRNEKPIDQGISVTIESSTDSRINTRSVITHDNKPQPHVWISVPTDYHIIVSVDELKHLHEVIGATLTRLS